MRIIKLGFISIIFFSLLITGISLFFPSHIRISKAIDINASKDSVLNQIKDAANWKKWYPGADTLPLLITGGKTTGLVLDSLQGIISITNSNDSSVEAVMAGPRIRDAITGWNIYQSAVTNNVTVQWYMDFHLRWYPWEKFGSLVLEGSYGPEMEKGLSNLRRLLEN